MAARHEVSANALLQEEKSLYLDSMKSEGGDTDGFLTWIGVKYRTDPDRWRLLADQFLKKAAQSVWNSDPRPNRSNGPSLFTIAGVDPGVYLNFPDPKNPKACRKVSVKYATVGQALGKMDLIEENLGAVQASRDEFRALCDEALKRSDGELGTSLSDLADPPDGRRPR